MSSFKIYRGFVNFIDGFRRTNGESSLSDSFIATMCKKLDEDFYNKTGIRISKSRGKVNFGPFFSKDLRYSFEGKVGTFKGNLGIDILIIGHDIKWQSRKGDRLIYPHEAINEDEVDFWFNNVQVESAKQKWKEIPPKLGVKIKPLSYNLNLESFTEHFYLCINFKDHNESPIQQAEQLFSETVLNWNNISLAGNQEMGIVHNWETHQRMSNLLVLYIDFGSAHEKLLKQILESLNDIEGIEKVTITSYPDEE